MLLQSSCNSHRRTPHPDLLTDWRRAVEASVPVVASIQLPAKHIEACERLKLQGQAQFLLDPRARSGRYHAGSRTIADSGQDFSPTQDLSSPGTGAASAPAPASPLAKTSNPKGVPLLCERESLCSLRPAPNLT